MKIQTVLKKTTNHIKSCVGGLPQGVCYVVCKGGEFYHIAHFAVKSEIW